MSNSTTQRYPKFIPLRTSSTAWRAERFGLNPNEHRVQPRLENGLHHQSGSGLQDAIPNSRNSERPLAPAARLGDVHPPDRLRPVIGGPPVAPQLVEHPGHTVGFTSAIVWPSMPAAPRLRRTCSQARSRHRASHPAYNAWKAAEPTAWPQGRAGVGGGGLCRWGGWLAPCPHPCPRRQHDRSAGPSLPPVVLSGASTGPLPTSTSSAQPPTSALALYGPRCRSPDLADGGQEGLPVTDHLPGMPRPLHRGVSRRAPSSHDGLLASPNPPRLATPFRKHFDAAVFASCCGLSGRHLLPRLTWRFDGGSLPAPAISYGASWPLPRRDVHPLVIQPFAGRTWIQADTEPVIPSPPLQVLTGTPVNCPSVPPGTHPTRLPSYSPPDQRPNKVLLRRNPAAAEPAPPAVLYY